MAEGIFNNYKQILILFKARLGVALVGSGRIGVVHMNNILSNQRFTLKYVVDVDLASAQRAAAKSPSAKPTVRILHFSSLLTIFFCSPI